MFEDTLESIALRYIEAHQHAAIIDMCKNMSVIFAVPMTQVSAWLKLWAEKQP